MKSGTKRGAKSGLRPKLLAVSVAACFAFSSSSQANPTGPTAVTGVNGIAGLGSAAVTVNTTGNAIINWQGFSIGVNEITRFLQSSAGSAVLNRVIGSGGSIPQSVIEGMLQSNGRVFLLNPSGVVIGPHATIDVAGFVASSLNLSNEDFLNGRMRFAEVPGAGSVVNQGNIQTTSGGNVYLVAPDVENTGIIHAPQGQILLAAGKSAELVSDASPYVTVKVSADSGQALNVGNLIAESGSIGMYGALVRNAGVAEASGAVAGPGGQIRFVAGKDLTLDAGSRVAANGASGGDVLLQAKGGTNLISGTVEATGASGKGGNIQALGLRVGVIGNGVIDASGDTRGGNVLLGGDYQGKNSSVQNAERTYIGPDGVIRADARTTGDGGRVIAWADEDTRFYGSISAHGGSQSGNGGFVETSGHSLQAAGTVDTRAPQGQGGTWLLDPDNIDIVSAGYGYGTFYGDGTILFGDSPTDMTGSNGLSVSTIDTALGSNGSVELQANNDITLQTDLSLSNSGNFTARAGNNISLGSHNVSLHGNLLLSANDNGAGSASGSGAITGDSSYGIATFGGSVTASGASIAIGSIDTTGATPGSINLTATSGSIELKGDLNSGAARTTLSAGDKIFQSGATIIANELVLSAVNGIGCGQCGGIQFLQTQVSNLQATNGQSGIEIQNIGDLTLRDLGAGYAIRNPDGAARISTSGTMSVTNAVNVGRRLELNAGGDLTVNGSLATAAQSPSLDGGDISLSSSGGQVVVSGSIDTRGANGQAGSSQYYGGGYGGNVDISASGAVSISGPINTSGGAGATTPDSWGGDGGAAGGVSISGSSVSVASITARGGNGGNGGSKSALSGTTYLDVSGGDGGEGGFVALQASYGALTVAGTIDARGGAGGTGGSASLTLTGSEGTGTYGDVYADAGDGGYGGPVSLAGSSVNTSDILTRGGDGGHGGTANVSLGGTDSNYIEGYAEASGGWGGDGGAIYVASDSGNVVVANIDARGGNGGAGGSASASNSGTAPDLYSDAYADGGGGGSGAAGGGFLNLDTERLQIEALAYGGDGSGGLTIVSGGSISTGNIMTASGAGGAGGIANASVNGSAGYVSAYADASGGSFYYGGPVSMNAANSIATGNIDSHTANGGAGGKALANASSTAADYEGYADAYASGGDGGEGSSGEGFIDLFASGGPISTGNLTSQGGNGGSGGVASATLGGAPATGSTYAYADGGEGYFGGYVSVGSSGNITTGTIRTAGGNGGQGGSASSTAPATLDAEATASGGSGAWGGEVNMGSDSDISSGAITTSGGSGGNAGSTSSSNAGSFINADGGEAGDGGGVDIEASTAITTGKITAMGGRGGNATLATGSGGSGGWGGQVFLSATDSVMVGAPATPGVNAVVIDSSGGAGGNGGSQGEGGSGGSAGSVTVDPTSITLNGIIQALGGAGGTGSLGGSGGNGGDLGLFTTDGTGTITFINGGWDLTGGLGASGGALGTDGVATIDGTLIFITLLTDALSNPEVAQQVGSNIDDLLQAANPDSNDDDDDDDDNKGGIGSCKP